MSDIKERLRDAVQKLRRTPMSISILAPLVQQAADHIATLEQESAANLQRALVAEKDAERYRWLRNESWAGYNSGKNKPEVFETVTMVLGSARNFQTILAEEALDDAIDAAILSDTSTQEVG